MTVLRRINLSWLFAAPALFLLTVFLIWPTFWAIRLSLDTGRGLIFREYVGLENYRVLFTLDRTFLNFKTLPPEGAIINNLIWLVLFVPLVIALGLAIAALADRVRYEAIIKSIVFVPVAISFVATGVIWTFVYTPNPNTGLLNALLSVMVPGFEPVSWLGRTDTVNLALIVAGLWMQTGFTMVILSAAVKGIPKELIEAGRIDGANEWSIFRHITLPLLRTPLTVITTAMIIYVFKLFDLVYIMTRGGPQGASRVIAYSFFVETFQSGKGGYGSAIAVVLLLFTLPVMLYQLRLLRQEAREG